MEAVIGPTHETARHARYLAQRKKSTPSPTSLLAHDTRNWLTVLRVYCDLLQTSGAVDARSQGWIDELSATVDRGKELVVSLLDSVPGGGQPTAVTALPALRRSGQSSIESGKAKAAQAPLLDLAAAIERRLPSLRRVAGEKIHVSLEMEIETAEAAIAECDFDRILQNLAVNAMEAMPLGGDLRIALSALHVERADATHPSSRILVLRVSDTGTGISPSLLPSIFQPGVSGKKPSAQHSSERGLGLAVVRELTLRAGGSVRVHSHGGRGTCFEIELPSAQRSSRQRQHSAAMSSRGRRTARPGEGRVGESIVSGGPANELPLRKKA